MTLNPKGHNLARIDFTTTVLKKPVQYATDEPRPPTISRQGQSPAEGSVDILWRIDGSADITMFGPTRFLVSSTFDLDSDLVLGKDDCLRYGLAQPKKRRRLWKTKN
jgi:hypothetical protein